MTEGKRMRELKPSGIRMNRLSLGLVVVCGVALVGCAQKGGDLAPISKGSQTAGGSPGSSENSPTEPTKTEAEKTAAARAEAALKKMEPRDEEMTIDREDEKWAEAKPAPVAVKRTVGAEIDDAFEKLPPAFVVVSIECVDRGDQLRFNPKIKINSPEKFRIEYALPETGGSLNTLTSDGQKRVQFEGEKWTELPKIGANSVSSKMNRAQIEIFAKRMPVDGFRFWSYGDRIWSAFIAGLNDPANGFEVETTQMNANPVGDERPFIRVLAKSSKGTNLELELVVDTKRYVPVTFRTNFKYADGQERMMLWKGDWAFGSLHEDKEFKNPKPLK